ncbi:TonB-dependent receptor [Lacimicrobium sp. SS2-24]|uniref:TonB-dependent receptor plug domain-containing protein n=1 Tax=Lacimicrobium sp. SS2-24 TaxID=2005569 RepID=UPI000B4A6905|nr:TonB-dependent receptor [Lacimicrobium sp. SS2-24]
MKYFHSAAAMAVKATLCASPLTHAQPIETISVIGASNPLQQRQLSSALTQIDRDEIEASGAISLAELLRGQPGISLSRSGARGAVTQIRMRGSEANHVLVMVDGVEINDLSDGGVDFAHLHLDNIASIEILRGPQSALWGNGAVAGVISITTLTADSPLSGGVSVAAGEANSLNVAASARGQQQQFHYAFNLSDYQSDGQNVSRQGDEKDGYKNRQFNTHLGWQATAASRINLRLRHVRASSDYDETDYMVTGLPQDSDHYTDIEQYQGKLDWRYTPKDSQWQQDLGLELNHNDNQNVANGTYTNANESEKLRLYWQGSYQYKNHSHVSVIAERTEEDFNQQDPAGFSDQSRSNDANSIGLDWLHQVNDNWSVSAGFRHDSNNFFDNAQSYQSGISYSSSPGNKLYISVGKAIKNPTFLELFGYFPGSFVGNPDLKPEQSVSMEVGAEIQLTEDWQLSGAWYSARLKDEISNSADFTSSINLADDSERQGVELEITGNWQQWQFSGAYSYLDSQQPDFSGELKPELRRARHSGHITARYRYASIPLSLYAKASYQGTQLDTNFLTFSRIRLPAYTLLDLTLNYELSPDWSLALRAENLLDHDHEDVLGFVGQQKQFWLSVDYQF